MVFGIKLSLIGILFRQLRQNRKLWQHSRVSWSTRSASLFPPLQPDTPQWRAAGVFTQSQSTFQPVPAQLCVSFYALLAPAVTVGETEGAMDSTSVFFWPLLSPITL